MNTLQVRWKIKIGPVNSIVDNNNPFSENNDHFSSQNVWGQRYPEKERLILSGFSSREKTVTQKKKIEKKKKVKKDYSTLRRIPRGISED